jgi:hypothetical protein
MVWVVTGVSPLPRNISYFAVAVSSSAVSLIENMNAVAALCPCAVTCGGSSKISHAQRHAEQGTDVFEPHISVALRATLRCLTSCCGADVIFSLTIPIPSLTV